MSKIIESMVNTYLTPKVMRHKADFAGQGTQGTDAREMVRLMRRLAHNMETGEPDEEAADYRFTQSLHRHRLVPTTVDSFAARSVCCDADTHEQPGVGCC